jgi:hypothetical protein
MATYRHPRQGPRHVYRYGVRHWYRHQLGVNHGHIRKIRATNRRWAGFSHQTRLLMVIGGAVVVLAIAAGIFSTFRALTRAHSDLDAAHAILARDIGDKSLVLSSSGRYRLQSDIDEASADAYAAYSSLHSNFVLGIVGHLPLIGSQRTGLLQLSSDIGDATANGAALLSEIDLLAAHSNGTTVSLSRLEELDKVVVAARTNLVPLDRPASGLWGPIATARREFDSEDAKLVNYLTRGQSAIPYAEAFLGSGGTRTYLVAGENNAEMRDQGSVESLAVLKASGGSFSADTVGSVDDLEPTSPVNVAVPAGTSQVFGSFNLTGLWQSVNPTADFAFSGADMQALYQQATGQHVDGVVALDVPALSSLLALTGPVTVPDIAGPITSGNVAQLLLHQLYENQPPLDTANPTPRHDEIAAVAKAVVDKMQTEHIDLASLANTLANLVQGRHLLVWDDVASYESELNALGASGAIGNDDPSRTFHLAVENATATKLDYYVGVDANLHITIDPQGDALVNTDVTLVNFAPAGQSPSLQLGPDGINSKVPGQYVGRIFLWSPEGSQSPGSVSESGLQVSQGQASVLAQKSAVVSFGTVIPHALRDGRFDLRLIPQSRLVPASLHIEISAPGYQISGPPSVARSWSTTLNLSWGLTPG